MLHPESNSLSARRYRVELITAESESSLLVRHRRLIRFPQLMSPRELLMGMEWAARQFYSLASIFERMARSRTGLWWNIARNLGYHLALRNFGPVGFNPEGSEPSSPRELAAAPGREAVA